MDKVKYVNHLGESLDLRSNEIMSSYVALKEFTLNMSNGILIGKSKKTPLMIVCLNRNAANKLIDFLETDSINNQYGKIFINDWYIEVMYQGLQSIKKEYGEKILLKISFYVKQTMFTRQKDYVLSPKISAISGGLDYNRGYPYDFGGDPLSMSSIENTEKLDADFILKFTAPTKNVSITIGDNVYAVDFQISEGETFVLDTETKRVYKTSVIGETNLFPATSDQDYIFKKIKSGIQRITWDGSYPITLKLLEHRRTPLWI